MKKPILLILTLLFLFSSLFAYFYFTSFKKVDINGNVFKAELAVSDVQRAKGLSGRKSLCEKCAMLFVFEHPGDYSFWMKDMRFSLDIIWILDSRIVYISGKIPLESKDSIRPSVLADKVLEINGGLADKYSFKIGDKVIF